MSLNKHSHVYNRSSLHAVQNWRNGKKSGGEDKQTNITMDLDSWAETAGSRSRREIPGPVQNKQAGSGAGTKIIRND